MPARSYCCAASGTAIFAVFTREDRERTRLADAAREELQKRTMARRDAPPLRKQYDETEPHSTDNLIVTHPARGITRMLARNADDDTDLRKATRQALSEHFRTIKERASNQRPRVRPEDVADGQDVSTSARGSTGSGMQGARATRFTKMTDEELDALISCNPGPLKHDSTSCDYEASVDAREALTEKFRRAITPGIGKACLFPRGVVY
jgi:hypothetical protein